MLALALCIDGVGLWWFVGPEFVDFVDLPRALAEPGLWAMHVVLASGGLVFYQRNVRALGRAPLFVFCLIVLLWLGPLGTVLGLLTLTVFWLSPADWTVTVADEVTGDPEQSALLREVALPAQALTQPQSLCDIFRFGTLPERRAAVAMIGANYRPAFAEALRMALHDEHNAIRVQAGMVMQSLEDAFEHKHREIEARLDRTLVAHGFGSDDVMLQLGRLSDHRAYSGLLDVGRAAEARSKARRAYRAHLQKSPTDLEAVAALGRLLVRDDRAEEAIEEMERAIASGSSSVPIWMWYAEALYRARRFERLREIMIERGDRLRDALPANSALRATIELWRRAEQESMEAGWRPDSQSEVNELTVRSGPGHAGLMGRAGDRDGNNRPLEQGRRQNSGVWPQFVDSGAAAARRPNAPEAMA